MSSDQGESGGLKQPLPMMYKNLVTSAKGIGKQLEAVQRVVVMPASKNYSVRITELVACFKPNEKELKTLNEGGVISLSIVADPSKGYPPVSLEALTQKEYGQIGKAEYEASQKGKDIANVSKTESIR